MLFFLFLSTRFTQPVEWGFLRQNLGSTSWQTGKKRPFAMWRNYISSGMRRIQRQTETWWPSSVTILGSSCVGQHQATRYLPCAWTVEKCTFSPGNDGHSKKMVIFYLVSLSFFFLLLISSKVVHKQEPHQRFKLQDIRDDSWSILHQLNKT